MVVRTMAAPLGRVRRVAEAGGILQTVALETREGLRGDPLLFRVQIQEEGGACLIEKSLLHFLIRLLRCIYSANASCHRYLDVSVLHSCMLASSYRPAGRELLCCC